MNKNFLLIAGIILVIAGITLFLVSERETFISEDKIKIAASFYPLAEFARQTGGERVEVITVTPAGIDPHDFEPTPRDLAGIYSADIFLYNGAGFDAWAERIIPDLRERNILVVNMSEHFELLLSEEDEDHDAHEEETSHADEFDPHIWLDPLRAVLQVEIIRDSLSAIDSENEGFWRENAARYINKLAGLDQKYKEGLSSCQKRDIVTSHAAFGYLAHRYDLNVISIAGISPEEEPSPRKLAEVAELARRLNIEYIFFETLASPRLAETLAREIGARTLVFNPLEGLTEEEKNEGKNYISIMEENLANLRLALRCQ